MSNKRRSSRATNATNILEQQKINKALRRSAASHGPEPRLEHLVLSDQKCAPVWNIFSRYSAQSPRIRQRTDEASPSAGGRSLRRRGPHPRPGAEEGGEDGGDESLTGTIMPAAATAAAEAAKAWDNDGHHVIDLLQQLLSPTVTAPPHLQEALMHIVLNTEAHAGSSLPQKAFRVLQQLLEWHPAAKLEGDVLQINDNLWAPVGCPWQADPHKDKPRLQCLREAGGLGALVGSAHNFVLRAAEAVGGAKLPSAQGAPEFGDLGEILLLKYWVKLLQVDLDARLGLMRLWGFKQRRTSILENSLVYRLMQTYTNWSDGSNSKPLLIRQLAAIVVCANHANKHGNRPAPAAARNGNDGNAGEAGGSGGGAAGAAAALQQTPQAQQLQLLITPAEVGSLAVGLLSMMYDVYDALDRMRFYVRQGAQGRDNDLVRMDLVMTKAILKELPYKDPGNVRVLLSSLPPAATVRLLVRLLADAAARRLEVGEQLGGNLRDVVEHYQDNGVGLPPQIRASDALHYLLEEPTQRQTGVSNWNWAGSAFHFNNQLPHRAGLALLAAQLTTAALQQAQKEARAAAAAAAAAARGGDDDDAEMRDADREGDDEEVDGRGAEAWEAEVVAVAELYRRVVARLEADGVFKGREATDCVVVSRRCADRLVARVAAVGGLKACRMPLRV